MKELNDGGPAFPMPETELNFYERVMSLRDYFAAHAPRQTPHDGSDTNWSARISEACEELGIDRDEHMNDPQAFWSKVEAARRYAYADAMLRAREVKP